MHCIKGNPPYEKKSLSFLLVALNRVEWCLMKPECSPEEMLHTYTSQKSRVAVKNWPAYLLLGWTAFASGTPHPAFVGVQESYYTHSFLKWLAFHQTSSLLFDHFCFPFWFGGLTRNSKNLQGKQWEHIRSRT